MKEKQTKNRVTHENDVRLVDPDFLPELSSDVTQSFGAVEAHGLQATVAQHLCHLSILLTVLFEDLHEKKDNYKCTTVIV